LAGISDDISALSSTRRWTLFAPAEKTQFEWIEEDGNDLLQL
jgi:hypothetical protein